MDSNTTNIEYFSEPEPGRVFVVNRLPNDAEIAELTSDIGRAYTTEYSVQYLRNNKERTVWILKQIGKDPIAAKIIAAREAVANLTGYDLKSLHWTFPGLARDVNQWLNVKQRPTQIGRSLLPAFHFQQCKPCLLSGQWHLWDMKAAYWQIASRAESLLCDVRIDRPGITWLIMSSQQEARWNAAKIALEPHKRLRLAIIGTNAVNWQGTGETRSEYWFRGKREPMPGQAPTCFQNLAISVIRIAYELTQLQSLESPGFYANADSILMQGKPTVWSDLGIEYSSKADGDADVLAVGSYRVGHYKTKPYPHLRERNLFTAHAPKFLPECAFYKFLFPH